MPNQSHTDAIQMLAYRFWEERGRPLDSSEIDWYRAEKEFHNSQVSEPSDADFNFENNVDETDIGSPIEVLSLGLDSERVNAQLSPPSERKSGTGNSKNVSENTPSDRQKVDSEWMVRIA